MLRVFQTDLLNTDDFIITLELVPGKESVGRSVDTVMGIAKDSFSDGRISAVSITDNPGGNPSLSPDVMGYEIFKVGMDVIVHFTCRDLNRVGMESRALQLAIVRLWNRPAGSIFAKDSPLSCIHFYYDLLLQWDPDRQEQE